MVHIIGCISHGPSHMVHIIIIIWAISYGPFHIIIIWTISAQDDGDGEWDEVGEPKRFSLLATPSLKASQISITEYQYLYKNINLKKIKVYSHLALAAPALVPLVNLFPYQYQYPLLASVNVNIWNNCFSPLLFTISHSHHHNPISLVNWCTSNRSFHQIWWVCRRALSIYSAKLHLDFQSQAYILKAKKFAELLFQ